MGNGDGTPSLQSQVELLQSLCSQLRSCIHRKTIWLTCLETGLPTSFYCSLAGSSLPPPEWKLKESGQEGLKLCFQSRSSKTIAVAGQDEQIEGGNGARLVPRLLGLSGHRRGWPHDSISTSVPCPVYSSSSQSTHKEEAF